MQVKANETRIRQLRAEVAIAAEEIEMIKVGAANAKTTARAEQKAAMEEALLNHEQVKSVQLRTIKQFKQKHAEMFAKTHAAGHVSTIVGDGCGCTAIHRCVYGSALDSAPVGHNLHLFPIPRWQRRLCAYILEYVTM